MGAYCSASPVRLSIDDDDFIGFLGRNVAKRELAWVIVAKQLQMSHRIDATEVEKQVVVAQLRRLGFRRVIVQNASGQSHYYICHDTEAESGANEAPTGGR